MKETKSQVCLFIFHELLKGNKIHTQEIMENYSISRNSFARDIQEIRSYLHSVNSDLSIKFNKKENCYYLVRTQWRENNLVKKEKSLLDYFFFIVII